jgi:hypothetical protein
MNFIFRLATLASVMSTVNANSIDQSQLPDPQTTPAFPAKRRYPRMVVDVPVRVFASDNAGNRAIYGRGHDISVGGMAIYAPLELAEKEIVQISFELPYSRVKFGVRGVVRNRNGFRYGVSFVGLSDGESAELARITGILSLTGDTR